jgi:superfamily II DNA or RNA helicase
MTNIRIAANPVSARILDADDALKLELSELLSFQVAGAEHSQAFKQGSWSGRSTLFGYERGTFPAGLVHLVITHLKQRGHQISLIRAPAPDPLGEKALDIDAFGYTDEYDYQYKTVEALVKHRAIIAQVATGGGKSRIANLTYARIKRPTLFITTRSVLMHQMRRSFDAAIEYRRAQGESDMDGVYCGVMGDSEWLLSRHLNVAMVQTIMSRLKDPSTAPQMQRILEHFEFVILEEAHESSGEGYYQIMNACKNAVYRLALTATPFMRDDEEANMRLMAVSGPIGIRVSEKELIDKGILATPQFKILSVKPPERVKKLSNWQLAYKYGIVHNEVRNQVIADHVAAATKAGLSSMVLVQRREHGQLLVDLLRKAHVRTKYIFGDSDQAERDSALADLRDGRIDCLIGSTILDVGVDCPAVGLVVLAGAGKAEVALRQRIGRGLRRKPKPMRNVAYVLEFKDTINRHLIGHAEQRRQILESTPGFAENILPPGAKFDFEE